MSKTPKVKIKLQPAVVMEAEVARKIRQHCRTSMKAEVCGVLIGEATEERTVVEACIAGENAAQGGAHVTFTQDTWEHIYRIKDKEHPDAKIVGWYHSHPGFGVFLSEHDLFIHENFFSSPNQVAWVFDPHTDEEGCFGWVSGKIEKLSGVRIGYSQSVKLNGNGADKADFDNADHEREDSRGTEDFLGKDFPGKRYPSSRAEEPAWVKWVSWSLGYLAAVVLGAAVGFLFGERNVAKKVEQELGPTLGACQQILEHPLQACQEILQRYGPAPSGAATLPAESQPKPIQPSAPAGKGKNGKR